jgi:glycosyltransferase involved in cell wall biosynthesis
MSILKPKKLKITIITVTYNSEKTIKTALKSVKDQTYKEIEHIIIDGNSADKTVSIIKQYSYINKIISEPDDGVYDAMNKGINIAKGDIVGFLNSDDFYVKEDVLSRAVGVFEDNPSLEACYADLIYVDQLDISKKSDIRNLLNLCLVYLRRDGASLIQHFLFVDQYMHVLVFLILITDLPQIMK